jgi:hypothetical protein
MAFRGQQWLLLVLAGASVAMGWTPDAEASSVFSTLLINGIIFSILSLLFEALRGSKVDIYMPKVRGCSKYLLPKEGVFAWAWQILQLEDNHLLERVGMDGYVLARWLRMCSLVGCICSFFALTVLIPVYYTAAGDAHAMNLLTMANIDTNGNALWAPLIFAYLFT